MKKIIALFSIIFLLAITQSFAPAEKELIVKASLQEWSKQIQKIDIMINYIDNQANLPNQDTKFFF